VAAQSGGCIREFGCDKAVKVVEVGRGIPAEGPCKTLVETPTEVLVKVLKALGAAEGDIWDEQGPIFLEGEGKEVVEAL
jgi:DNA gyrase/topoisomerase IV subunit B